MSYPPDFPYKTPYQLYWEANMIEIIIVELVLAAPNLLISIIKLVQCKKVSTFFSFLHCIAVNTFYTFMIFDLKGFGKLTMASYIILGIIGGLLLLNTWICPCGPCTCCSEQNICAATCEIWDRGYPEYEDCVKENRSLPPKLIINTKASHEESRQVWVEKQLWEKIEYKEDEDGRKFDEKVVGREVKELRTHYSPWGRVDEGGGQFTENPGCEGSYYDKHTETRTVYELDRNTDVSFNTWEDQTEDLELPNEPYILVKFYPKYTTSPQDNWKIEGLKNKLKREGGKYDSTVTTGSFFSVPGFRDYGYAGYKLDRFICMAKFGNSFFFKLLYFIGFVTGYSFLLESLLVVKFNEQHLYIIKHFSSKDDLRVQWGEKDDRFITTEV